MRRFDKKKQMDKANLLAEQRYLESKGIIKEYEDYKVDPDTGEVTGGQVSPVNKYGFDVKPTGHGSRGFGENSWAYEGYGLEVYDAIKKGKPLTPSQDVSIENHQYIKSVIDQYYGKLSQEALNWDMGFRVTDNDGVVTIGIETWDGPKETYICTGGTCKLK